MSMSALHKIAVSVITPTYNRPKFIRNAIAIYRAQTFPKELMEWIILDDGDQPVEAILLDEAYDIPNIRYIREYSKQTIGAKRNRLNREAKGAIIVSWDDDDYYPPDRIKCIIDIFTTHSNVQLVGSSLLYYYFKDDHTIWSLGPFGKYHSTNGPLAYTKNYSNTHKYDESVFKTEEPSFLNNFMEPLIQMDPKKAMLVICHEENTSNKDNIRNGLNSAARKTSFKIEDFIEDEELIRLYKST